MNRCAQVVADGCVSSLAALIERSGGVRLDALTFNSSLKYSCLYDPAISIEITSPSQFDVVEFAAGVVVSNVPAISSARLSDFFLGATRVKRQHDAALALKKSSGVSAWMLVSAYYCAYFASLELAKIFGRFSMSLEAEELSLLQQKATGPDHAEFFQAGHANFSGSEFAGKLVFRAIGTRPHASAWENARFALRRVLGEKAWPEAVRFLELIENQSCAPNVIRNTWNYKRADFYGGVGEAKASEFRKLLGNAGGVYSWLQQRRGRLPDLEPCAIAVLCEGLAEPIADAASRAKELLRLQTVAG